MRATLPVTTVPIWYFSAAFFHGLFSSSLRVSAIFVSWISLIMTFTLSPTLNSFLGSATRPHDISEMWRSPSAPPKSMNAPKSVRFLTVPSTIMPTLIRESNSSCIFFFLATINCLRSPIILLLRGLTSVRTNSTSWSWYLDKSLSYISDTKLAGINTRPSP